MTDETGIRLNRTGRATGDRYRYLDDDKNDGNRYFYLDDGNYKSDSSRYVGERTSITVNGVVAGQNAGGEVSYFTTDLLGSVRTTTDNAGFGTNSYTYDAFGSLVEGELSGATDYGYLGKQFDSVTGLYNYGYRAYAPVVARFTTVDPICDGSNWFSYVDNDPLNFVDLWGLELYIKGDSEYIEGVKKDLQKLTNDTVYVNNENGKVSVSEDKNSPNNKPTGTELLREITSDKSGHDTTIDQTYSNEVKQWREQPDYDATTGYNNTVNGIGADTKVSHNPNAKDKSNLTMQNEEKVETSRQTRLAHELIHAYHDNNGTSADFPNTNTANPENLLAEYQDIGINGYENEKFTENKIREEQGDPQRCNY